MPATLSPGSNVSGLATFLLAALIMILGTPALAGDHDTQQAKPLFRVGVDTVCINVVVSDPHDHFVAGLDRAAFRVFDDKVEQEITLFSAESVPVSAGILFDRSASMYTNNMIGTAAGAVKRFLKSARPEDEYFLITFDRSPRLACDFTHNPRDIIDQLALAQPRGRTAIYDALYLGLEKIKQGSNGRKALILITDGEENHSRYSVREVKELARESNVEVYVIGTKGGSDFDRICLEELAEITGGQTFFPDDFNDLDQCARIIQEELRNQYVLGFRPAGNQHDRRWHHIRVKTRRPDGYPRLYVRARTGYYASE